jgi:hypothetical protein
MEELVDLGDRCGWPKMLAFPNDAGLWLPAISPGASTRPTSRTWASQLSTSRVPGSRHAPAAGQHGRHGSRPKPPQRPCWHCAAFDGLTAQGTAALCRRPGCCRVRAAPVTGCCEWQRETGSDDEPFLPGCSISTPWTPVFTAEMRDPLSAPVEWAPSWAPACACACLRACVDAAARPAGGGVHGCSSVDERGGLPRSTTSQNCGCNELPRPRRSAYRGSGLVRWPRPVTDRGHRKLTFRDGTARANCISQTHARHALHGQLRKQSHESCR